MTQFEIFIVCTKMMVCTCTLSYLCSICMHVWCAPCVLTASPSSIACGYQTTRGSNAKAADSRMLCRLHVSSPRSSALCMHMSSLSRSCSLEVASVHPTRRAPIWPYHGLPYTAARACRRKAPSGSAANTSKQVWGGTLPAWLPAPGASRAAAG